MNTDYNIWTIPDVHGRNDLLTNLLDQLFKYEDLDLSRDKLIFLGDYIDRGSDSKGVLDTLIKLKEDHPENVICLYGNHEDLCINACVKQDYDDFYLWNVNGGNKTLKSFPTQKVPEDYIRWLSKLPLSYETEKFFFSHAPIPKEHHRLVYLRDQPFSKEELIWSWHGSKSGSSEDEFAREHKDKIGVCGHVHMLRHKIYDPRFYDHYIYADAGCGCHPKAPLVAIEVQSRKVIYEWPIEAQETNS